MDYLTKPPIFFNKFHCLFIAKNLYPDFCLIFQSLDFDPDPKNRILRVDPGPVTLHAGTYPESGS